MTVADFAAAVRDGLDLAAQQEMAYWSLWTFFATCASVAVSAIALVGLWMSLAQTRSALVQSKDLAKAELRAYVHADFANHTGTIANYSLLITITNSGATPAQSFQIGGKIFPGRIGHIAKLIEDNLAKREYRLKAWSPIAPGASLSVRMDTAEYHDLIRRMAKQGNPPDVFNVVGTVRYLDIFGDWYETDFAFFSRTTDPRDTDGNKKLRRPTIALRAYHRVEGNLVS